uniref:hypothetical protein n=1 Tax=Comamonas suwonensis TaxID=2606214 RepID=UPI0038B24DF6
MDLRGASAVPAQLAQEFGHFNEIHPRSSLKLMLPRESRRRQNPSIHQELDCFQNYQEKDHWQRPID